jgi:hypothetical protein
MTEPCLKCGQSGSYEENGKVYECSCAVLRRLAAAMPVYIRTAPVEKKHITIGIAERVRSSLFLKAAWADVKAIIKVAMYKHPNFHFRLTSDREIRDVGVGSASRNARGEEAVIVYNSLQELMESPKLVIVRLNELGYKNKAAPGFVEEAISIRLDRGYPVWLISDLNKPFTPGSFAYSEQLWDLICSSFDHVSIPRISNPQRFSTDDQNASAAPRKIEVVDVSDNAPEKPVRSFEKPKPDVQEEKIRPAPVVEEPEEKESKNSMYGSGLSGSRVNKKPFKIRPSEDSDDRSSRMSVYGQGIEKPKNRRGQE